MILTLINNLALVILAAASVFMAESPVLLLIAGGLLLIVLTAEYMDVKTEPAKLVLMLVFAVSGGFVSFAVFALDDKIKPVYRAIMASAGYIAFAAVSGIVRDKADGEYFAYALIKLLVVLAITIVIILIQFAVKKAGEKAAEDEKRIRSSNISEMRERKQSRELAKQNYLSERNARLLERENISRNIHNSVGHTITAAIMTLDAADMLYDVKPDEARKRMNDANERMRGSLDSIRRAVRTLDEDGAPVPVKDLLGDFDGIIDEFVMDSEYKVTKEYELDETILPAVDHEHAMFLTGVLQEMLTNGVKHGHADYFNVNVTGDSAHIRLTVKDNGSSDYNEENSEEKIEKGFGIKKIISYVNRCGGKTEFKNDDGFLSAVELPVENGGYKNE